MFKLAHSMAFSQAGPWCSLAASGSTLHKMRKSNAQSTRLSITTGSSEPMGRLGRKQVIPTELHKPYSTLCSKP